MSARPLNVKRANRVRKAMRSDLPRFMDLVQWLKDRNYAQTTGEAEKIILAGRVKSESHTLGIKKAQVVKPTAMRAVMVGRPLTADDYEERDVVERYIPASFGSMMQVLPA